MKECLLVPVLLALLILKTSVLRPASYATLHVEESEESRL